MPQFKSKNQLSGTLYNGNQPVLRPPGRPVAVQGSAELIPTLRSYQSQEVIDHWDKKFFARFWKPRVGKTPTTIREAMTLHYHQKIEAVIVLVRNPLHLNWSQVEIPIWNPTGIVYEWESNKKNYPPIIKTNQLVWFCANIEALQIPGFQEYLIAFAKEYKTLLIIDEVHDLKSSKFKRSNSKRKPRARIAREVSRHYPYKRILTGTPDPNGPFDYWSLFYILDPNILGSSSTKFKATYGNFENSYFGGQRVPTLNKEHPYKNLDDLHARIAPHCSRRELEPNYGITYQKHFFDLSPKLYKKYKQLEDEFFLYIQNELITVEHVLTRLIRLQELSRGFFQGQVVDYIPSINALMEIIDPNEKTIVWCHFKHELALLDKYIQDEHITISAEVKSKDRLPQIKCFNESKTINLMLSTPSLSGSGTDISGATHMIFFSHSFSADDREQAIHRNQGEKQKAKTIFITDMIAANTVDLQALKAIETKQNFANYFKGVRR